MKNIKRKRIRYFIRSPLFLFIGFSVLYFVQTAIAQEAALSEPQPTPDIINRGDAARLAAELEKQQAEQSQSNSPAKVALEEARAAKQAAEQALANAQTKLEEAIATQQGAQDQLTTAQTTLYTATTVQQQAQAAADEEAAATTEALRVAQAAVDQAQQEVGNAQTTLDQAQSALDALNQQIAVSKNKVNEATATKESAKRALQTALAKVQEFTGQPVDGGSNPTNPGDGGTGGGTNPPDINLTTLKPEDWDCVSRDAYGGPGTVIDLPPARSNLGKRGCVIIEIYDDGNEYSWDYLKNSTVRIRTYKDSELQLGKDGGPYSGGRRIALYDAIEDYLDAGNEIVARNTGGGINCKDKRREPNAAGPRADVLYCYDSDIPLGQGVTHNPGRQNPVFHLVVKGSGKRTLMEVDGSKELFSNLNNLRDGDRNDIIKKEYQRRNGLSYLR